MKSTVKPLSPDDMTSPEVLKTKFPDFVIEVFNTLLVKHWDGRGADFKQDEAVEALLATGKVTEDEIFDNHYLDIEPYYRSMGWKVEFDKPGYCESYKANWKFRK